MLNEAFCFRRRIALRRFDQYGNRILWLSAWGEANEPRELLLAAERRDAV